MTADPIAPARVVLLTPDWSREGGVGSHVQASAAALAARGVKVTVLATRADGEAPAGIELLTRPMLFERSFSAAERVGAWGLAEGSVVHAHNVDDPALVEYFQRSAPTLVSAHAYTGCAAGMNYFQPGEPCSRAHTPACLYNMAARGCDHTRQRHLILSKYRRSGTAMRALHGADLVVSYSSAVDRHLAINGLGRRAVVPLFPTLPALEPSAAPREATVLFAARIVGPKGLDVLIRAAPQVDARFVVCGDGRRLPEMRALAEQLGVLERFSFRGWLQGDEFAAQLAASTLVAIPSKWPEPFGLVGIEALAAGRPAVASDGGGIVDWLQDGVNGLLVPPGDVGALAAAIGELVADPQRCAQMGAAGHRMVAERFSPEQHVTQLMVAYRQARLNWETAQASAA